MYEEKQVLEIKESIKKALGCSDVVFKKVVGEDLYYVAYDSNGIEDKVRVKPQLGTVFTWFEGNWRQVRGYKIN